MTESYPYSDAPRLPDAGPVDFRRVLASPDGPVELEIGPGRGGFMVERLDAEPRVRMVGLEIRKKWATLVDRRLQATFGGRARVFAEDARAILPRVVDASISCVFIHFPDPWWKKRHHKRRVVSEPLVSEIARILEPSGQLFVQTDVGDRADSYEQVIAREPRLRPWGERARVAENPFGAQSPRERRVSADGLPVIRLRFQRVGRREP